MDFPLVINTKNTGCSVVNNEKKRGKPQPIEETKKGVPPVTYTEALLKDLFKSCDANGDRLLSRKELKKAFASLGSFAPGWRAFRALSRADKNRDGYIDEHELDYLVKYAAKRGYTMKL
ncbi:Parvalbumin [Parasponia andersonii]|uniref:Parvalbumin n=1 Tax=Parasponia andersonii TaxID=3476 RepID=A0A2P5B0T4_PARAD|nr:Parvalbumin [Parasponia andersonii]